MDRFEKDVSAEALTLAGESAAIKTRFMSQATDELVELAGRLRAAL